MSAATQQDNNARHPLLPKEVEDALTRGATVLTANQRSARALQRSFSHQQISLQNKVWAPPDILSWGAWTASLWQRLVLDGIEQRLLLTALQEQAIWKDILLADRQLATLQRYDALAALAQRAWGLLARHHGLPRLRECTGSLDTETFLRWAIEFNRRCKAQLWLPESQLEEALCAAIEAGALPPGKAEFALVGFDRMTPSQAALRDAITAAGGSCEALPLTPPAGLNQRIILSANDQDEEALAAAWWALAQLEANPTARIAIILPDAAGRRTQMDRVFQHVLAPEQTFIADAESKLPYEFSLGLPLAHAPMVRTALSILRWAIQPLPFEQASNLLLSPYLADGSAELHTRARFDANTLRSANILQPDIALDWLIDQLEQEPGLASLQRQLTAARRVALEQGLLRSSAQHKSHDEWADCMRSVLQAAGWPGTQPLSSSEFQLLHKWQELLDQLCTLDFANFEATSPSSGNGSNPPRIEYSSALHTVERMTSETLFAPESHDAPIQIMGVLESAGSVFDAVLFLGATDAAWPASAHTAPLLPWQLQRSLRMPHSDPAQDYEHARAVTLRIASSAPVVCFSHAERDGKAEYRPSPLLCELESPSHPFEHIRAEEWIKEDWFASIPATELEVFNGDGSIAPSPDVLLRGGANLLKLQSLCPFRAFAEQRLGSADLRQVEAGLDAMERGSLVHSALEKFWNRVSDQQSLAAMPDGERHSLLSSIVDAVLLKRLRPATEWDRAYLNIQRQWLVRLLEQWLALELKRPPFKVLSNELERTEVNIGKLRLKVRPDRVDIVNDGEVIVDYKTGQASPRAWEGERPDEPQLPLYATLADPSKLRGVAFAQVRWGKMSLRGYATDAGILEHAEFKKNGDPRNGSKVGDLAAQVEEWRRVLESLADEFHRGVASVTPKSYPGTCKHCAQRPFCRISESSLASALYEEEAGEEEADEPNQEGHEGQHE